MSSSPYPIISSRSHLTTAEAEIPCVVHVCFILNAPYGHQRLFICNRSLHTFIADVERAVAASSMFLCHEGPTVAIAHFLDVSFLDLILISPLCSLSHHCVPGVQTVPGFWKLENRSAARFGEGYSGSRQWQPVP